MARRKRFKTNGEMTDVDGILRRAEEERQRKAREADPWWDMYGQRPRTTPGTEPIERIPTVGFDHDPSISARARKARKAAATSSKRGKKSA